jgi:hypothetical protein
VTTRNTPSSLLQSLYLCLRDADAARPAAAAVAYRRGRRYGQKRELIEAFSDTLVRGGDWVEGVGEAIQGVVTVMSEGKQRWYMNWGPDQVLAALRPDHRRASAEFIGRPDPDKRPLVSGYAIRSPFLSCASKLYKDVYKKALTTQPALIFCWTRSKYMRHSTQLHERHLIYDPSRGKAAPARPRLMLRSDTPPTCFDLSQIGNTPEPHEQDKLILLHSFGLVTPRRLHRLVLDSQRLVL